MEDQRALPAPKREVDFNPKNPYSVISLCGELFREHYFRHKEEMPALFELDEREYMNQAEIVGMIPTAVENIIRDNLWREYDKVCSSKDIGVFSFKHVYSGYFSDENFYGKYLSSPYRVAWILVPPTGLTETLNEALTYGVKKMRTLLEIPSRDSKIMAMQLNILKTLYMMEGHRNGSIKSGNAVNVQVNLETANAGDRVPHTVAEARMTSTKALDSMSVAELEYELEQIKEKAVEVVRATATDVNVYRTDEAKNDMKLAERCDKTEEMF